MIVVASGYFDPLHIGHIEYLNAAKSLGKKLIVIVNSDKAAIKKKGYFFMPQEERIKIINELKCVDQVLPAIDTDNTIAKTLEVIKPDIFAKGGDRDISNIPIEEINICKRYNIKIISGLGEKIASSSEIINKNFYLIGRNKLQIIEGDFTKLRPMLINILNKIYGNTRLIENSFIDEFDKIGRSISLLKIK